MKALFVMKAPIVRTVIATAAMSAAVVGCSPTDATSNRTGDAVGAGAVANVEDDRVETYVRARFQADDSIRGSDIDVSAQNGRVSLRGTVPSEEARQRAIASAREASGAQSIDDQLVVANSGDAAPSQPVATTTADPATLQTSADRARAPGWITTRIQAQYFLSPEISPWNIDVNTTTTGVVTLRGEVDDAGDRDEAMRLARAIEGVTQVDDRLVVKADAVRRDGRDTGDGRNTGSAEPDAWVTAKIQAKYFLDAEVKGRDIDVDTQNGTVTLRGQVSSEAERRQAMSMARNTEGVRDVSDQLTVTRTTTDSGDNQTGLSQAASTVDDAWITTKVQSKFFLDRDIKGSTINVTTSGGVVTLDGRVESAANRQAAEQIARETDGVSRVNNQLKVETTR